MNTIPKTWAINRQVLEKAIIAWWWHENIPDFIFTELPKAVTEWSYLLPYDIIDVDGILENWGLEFDSYTSFFIVQGDKAFLDLTDFKGVEFSIELVPVDD
jgi:hypothetical protein